MFYFAPVEGSFFYEHPAIRTKGGSSVGVNLTQLAAKSRPERVSIPSRDLASFLSTADRPTTSVMTGTETGAIAISAISRRPKRFVVLLSTSRQMSE